MILDNLFTGLVNAVIGGLERYLTSIRAEETQREVGALQAQSEQARSNTQIALAGAAIDRKVTEMSDAEVLAAAKKWRKVAPVVLVFLLLGCAPTIHVKVQADCLFARTITYDDEAKVPIDTLRQIVAHNVKVDEICKP